MLYRLSTNILATNARFRDTSAWYHIVLVVDTDNTVDDDRNMIYVNGAQVTSFAARTNLTINTNYPVNSAIAHGESSTAWTRGDVSGRRSA